MNPLVKTCPCVPLRQFPTFFKVFIFLSDWHLRVQHCFKSAHLSCFDWGRPQGQPRTGPHAACFNNRHHSHHVTVWGPSIKRLICIPSRAQNSDPNSIFGWKKKNMSSPLLCGKQINKNLKSEPRQRLLNMLNDYLPQRSATLDLLNEGQLDLISPSARAHFHSAVCLSLSPGRCSRDLRTGKLN
ncbi:hypothetical protein CEXT_410301 [Caerostris extrusa]|uniref:Uncharacterized protein n=1 Tax=Caerostris extrusa TaxID=172846 RepID=A0AAV4UM72_CAEEX|nr:hypothetical protein CEXT_410301 [Caerostris extrusa]